MTLFLAALAAALLGAGSARAHISCEAFLVVQDRLELKLPVKRKLLRYWGEYQAREPVYRFNHDEAAQFLTVIRNGLLYDIHGRPLDIPLVANLIIDPGGRIYIYPARSYRQQKVRHSSLPVPVAFAGSVCVVKGRIVWLNNGSGHYRFPRQTLLEVAEAFRRAGVTVEEDDVEDFSGRHWRIPGLLR